MNFINRKSFRKYQTILIFLLTNILEREETNICHYEPSHYLEWGCMIEDSDKIRLKWHISINDEN